MANDNSVTDIEAVNNVTLAADAKPEAIKADVTPPTQAKTTDKQDMTATQVDPIPEKEVSIDDFLAVKDGISAAQKQPVAKADDKKVDVVAAKPDPKTQDKTVLDKPVDTKPVAQDVKVDDKAKTDDDKRDYNDIPEEFRPIFKKQHNEPFNTFKPIVKKLVTELESAKTKLKETETKYEEVKKGALPDNYYEHQRGYILAPEFENAANTAIRAEQVANHWKAQLERIRKGEPTYQDVNVNPRTGELYLSDPMQVTKDSENKVAGYVDWAQSQLEEKRFVVRNVAEKHATTHRDAVGQVVDFEKAAFKNFDGEKAKEWEPIIQDTINKTFPPAFRNNPLAKGYAKALITVQQLGAIIKHLQENGGKALEVTKTPDGKVISEEDKKKAGPSGADMAQAGAATKAGDEEVTMDDFKRVKEGTANYRR